MKRRKNIGDIQIKPNKKRKKIIIISSIIIVILLIIGIYIFCFYKKEPVTQEKKEKQKEEKVVKPLSVVDENSNQRPIAVMIDNNVGATSHVGLQDAYITYEMIVEGGLTRIMVLFKDKATNLIGPVRSSRHYFLDYALEHDALYAHFGFSPYAEKDIKVLGVNNINGLYLSNAYWRDRTIAAPHNVFTNIETLYASASNLGYQITSDHWKTLNYTTDEVDLTKFVDKTVKCEEAEECNKNPNLMVANEVVIPYSSQVRSYRYDSNLKVYYRFMNGIAHTDKVTGEQYHYKNIIIEKVSNRSIDGEGRQDLTTEGSGEGFYITNGYALPIIWSKNSRSAKTSYKYFDGTEVKINDGNTFVQIEPSVQAPSFN